MRLRDVLLPTGQGHYRAIGRAKILPRHALHIRRGDAFITRVHLVQRIGVAGKLQILSQRAGKLIGGVWRKTVAQMRLDIRQPPRFQRHFGRGPQGFIDRGFDRRKVVVAQAGQDGEQRWISPERRAAHELLEFPFFQHQTPIQRATA